MTRPRQEAKREGDAGPRPAGSMHQTKRQKKEASAAARTGLLSSPTALDRSKCSGLQGVATKRKGEGKERKRKRKRKMQTTGTGTAEENGSQTGNTTRQEERKKTKQKEEVRQPAVEPKINFGRAWVGKHAK